METAKLVNIAIPIVGLVLFYVLLVMPQQKREKAVKEMRENLSAGDEIITIGGFHGKVLKVEDDVVTIELGADKTRLQIERWGIGKKVSKE
ncbi:MAG: preprotein translocase subunit YajC [Peptostreptococcaceae bacterium]|nr:preprotein translocase subunit YajC [Peptostreptococcaceae bacterium]